MVSSVVAQVQVAYVHLHVVGVVHHVMIYARGIDFETGLEADVAVSAVAVAGAAPVAFVQATAAADVAAHVAALVAELPGWLLVP